MELRSADGILVAARACDSALNCDSGAVTLVAGVQGNAAYLLSVKTSQGRNHAEGRVQTCPENC